MPLFMVERVLKRCRGRSKGYNHYGLPVSDIGVSDTRIQIAGAHVLIGIHQIQPPASNPLKVGDDTVGIIAVHRIIYPYFPIIIRYVKFLYYHVLNVSFCSLYLNPYLPFGFLVLVALAICDFETPVKRLASDTEPNSFIKFH